MTFTCVPDPHTDPYVGHLGSASGSLSQRYEYEDSHPDPFQNVTDPYTGLDVLFEETAKRRQNFEWLGRQLLGR
jgi:hypothetical protein